MQIECKIELSPRKNIQQQLINWNLDWYYFFSCMVIVSTFFFAKDQPFDGVFKSFQRGLGDLWFRHPERNGEIRNCFLVQRSTIWEVFWGLAKSLPLAQMRSQTLPQIVFFGILYSMHHFKSPATIVSCCHGHGNQNYITTAPPRDGRDGLAKAKRWRFFGGRLLLLGHCLDEDDDDMALEPQKKNSLRNLRLNDWMYC